MLLHQSANSGTKECLLDVDLVLGSTETTRMYRLHVDERDWSLETWQGSLRRRPNVVDRGQPSFEELSPKFSAKNFVKTTTRILFVIEAG